MVNVAVVSIKSFIPPPSSNKRHSEIQNLSSNIRHSGLRVDPTILIMHHFQVFSNRKMCMQPWRKGTYGVGAWERAC